MDNQTFFNTMEEMFADRRLIYAEKNLPDFYVRIKIGGHFIATSVNNVDFLKEIQVKIDDKQFFTEPQLNKITGKSSTYSSYEVGRGRYAKLYAGKFKLYVLKDW